MPQIRTLWKIWDDDALECIAAMDDEVTANDWDRWEKACAAAREVYGIQPEDTREVVIDVPYEPIAALFEVPTVTGTPTQERQTGTSAHHPESADA